MAKCRKDTTGTTGEELSSYAEIHQLRLSIFVPLSDYGRAIGSRFKTRREPDRSADSGKAVTDSQNDQREQVKPGM